MGISVEEAASGVVAAMGGASVQAA